MVANELCLRLNQPAATPIPHGEKTAELVHDLVGIEADGAGVVAYEGPGEDPRRPARKVISLETVPQVTTNLGTEAMVSIDMPRRSRSARRRGRMYPLGHERLCDAMGPGQSPFIGFYKIAGVAPFCNLDFKWNSLDRGALPEPARRLSLPARAPVAPLAGPSRSGTGTSGCACTSAAPNVVRIGRSAARGAAAVLGVQPGGACVFFEADRGNLCAVHSQLGAARCPACHIPRVVVHARVEHSSPSRICPTAAGLLHSPTETAFEIVPAPDTLTARRRGGRPRRTRGTAAAPRPGC